MDILHVSRVAGAAKGQYQIVFVYHSEEAKYALLHALHQGGFAWASGASLISSTVIPSDLATEGGLRARSNGDVYWGSLSTYRTMEIVKFRVVL